MLPDEMSKMRRGHDASDVDITGRMIMCDEKKCCQKPENLTGKPEECSPEQIKECHGDVEEHPCVKETGNDKAE